MPKFTTDIVDQCAQNWIAAIEFWSLMERIKVFLLASGCGFRRFGLLDKLHIFVRRSAASGFRCFAWSQGGFKRLNVAKKDCLSRKAICIVLILRQETGFLSEVNPLLG